MSSKNGIRYVNRNQLALLLDKSLVTIDAWLRRGMPFEQKGGRAQEWKFDVSRVTEWRELQAIESVTGNTKDVEYEEARRRKIAAEAGILEIELQKKRSQVLDRDDVEQGLFQAYITLKQRLRTIPERAIPQIISENDERLCSELLLNEIDDALLELSQLNYDASVAEPSEETPSSTTEADNI